MNVLLRCRNCGRAITVDARTADWPNCACGDAEWRIVQMLAAERVERGNDDPDRWRDGYDHWKTTPR